MILFGWSDSKEVALPWTEITALLDILAPGCQWRLLPKDFAADDTTMIYAATAKEFEDQRQAFIRTWRLRHREVADSLEEAGNRLFTFTRLPPSQMEKRRNHQLHRAAA